MKKIREHRLRRRHAERPHVPVIHGADRMDVYKNRARVGGSFGEGPHRQAERERDAGRLLHHLEPRRHRCTAFTPIINAPEVAILGVSKSSMKPVYKDGTFIPRLTLPLSLSYDHRVIDGAMAVRFTTWLAGVLADPRQLTEAVP